MSMVELSELIDSAPNKPGAYIFYDGEGAPIYVGKAGSLRNRLRSYLRPSDFDPKTRALMENAKTVKYTITDSETEALFLEYNLIKEHKPKYNVRYRDDKRYPYLKITADKHPRVVVTRRRENDGGRYFGPYPDGTHIRKILRFMKQAFKLRTCKGDVGKNKPCLSLDIGRCLGPCTGKLSEEEYDDAVEQAALFLKGDIQSLTRELKAEMLSHSRNLAFEEAARIRDLLGHLDSILLDRKVLSGDDKSRDLIGYASFGDNAGVSVFRERFGRVTGHFYFRLEGDFRDDESHSLRSFVRQYYSSAEIPDEIVLPSEIGDDGTLRFMREKKGRKVVLRIPKRGRLRKLLNLARQNARLNVSQEALGLVKVRALDGLARLAGLDKVERVEGYDVSNISGKHAVGSMVVFSEGKPMKNGYRRFRIKTVEGADDVAMMSEIISRRLGNKWKMPDVILVDGGRGQVNAACKALREAGLSIPVIGLAKKNENVYLGGKRGHLNIGMDTPLMKLLISIRDEAHRFAVTYHRSVMRKSLVSRNQS